jgi:hypothetical protein
VSIGNSGYVPSSSERSSAIDLGLMRSLSLVSINPERVVTYNFVSVECAKGVNALTLPQELQCTSGGRGKVKPYIKMGVLTLAIAVIAFGPL